MYCTVLYGWHLTQIGRPTSFVPFNYLEKLLISAKCYVSYCLLFVILYGYAIFQPEMRAHVSSLQNRMDGLIVANP